MDIVRFSGGLGNQMFQFAFMEALRSRGRDVKGSLGFYKKHPDSMPFTLCSVFRDLNIDLVEDSTFDEIDERWKELKRQGVPDEYYRNYPEKFFWVEDISKDPCTYHPEVFQTKNCVFVGYWQTEKYFYEIKDRLTKCFCFKKINSELQSLADTISKGKFASVHVRRGDYLSNAEAYMGICTIDYYKRAIEYLQKREAGIKFIFFSDDMEWIKQKIYMPEAVYCHKELFDSYEDWYDIFLMSKCRHNIIANSSFSWWGAWLNQNTTKIVIAPDKWLGYADTNDIWCDGWIRL